MKILVVDDTKVNLVMLSSFCEKRGYEVITAENGVEAVKVFQSESPDMVLMDVMMPVMDGFEATARIKELSKEYWVPVILVTALDQEENLIKGIGSGADDYVNKPINFTVLGERIKVMERIAMMQQKLSRSLNALQHYHDRSEAEMEFASYIINRLAPHYKIEQKNIKYWIQAAQQMCGDVVAAANAPGGILHVILADGTGHSLSAALSVLPVTEVFYAVTAKGFSLSSIVEELNHKVNLLLPVDRFVAATVLAIGKSKRSLQVWNGGGPTPLFINRTGQILHSWKSNHPPLGILKKQEFDSSVDVYQWNEPGSLYVFSDGLVDARDSSGEYFGQERLLRVLTDAPFKEGFQHLKEAVWNYLGCQPGHDDISLIEIDCPIRFKNVDSGEDAASQQKGCPSGEWKLTLSLGSDEMKAMDVLPFILRWLEQTGLSAQHCERIFLVVAKLYNNALDHGVLGLDSSIKIVPGGFEKYFDQRRERLAGLQEGKIEMHLERKQEENVNWLRIRVKDSGKGFNYLPYFNGDTKENTKPSGRGIVLVKSLCSKMEYVQDGNEVVVEYQLS